jgi:response regulator NasT
MESPATGDHKRGGRVAGAAERRRIMVVDDDRLVLATLAQGLAARGYDISAYSAGDEALDAYRHQPPDLVLLDVRMPGIDGIEAARLMLDHEHRPILMLSAYDDQPMVKAAVSLGVSGYLVKPIEVNQLVPSIEATLARFAEITALMQNSENLRQGMDQNRVISTAVGILMERGNLGQDQAFERLRRLARDQRRALREVAAEIVEALAVVNSVTGTRHDS